jgi:hypothetical protein
MATDYRIRLNERDFAQFITQNNFTLGAMVVKSKKGKLEPVLTTNQSEVVAWYGAPSSAYWGVYEAIDYTRPGNPLWMVRAIGDNYKYSGVDVTTTSVVPFGTGAGRLPGTIDYTAIQKPDDLAVDTADGLTITYTGTLASTPILEGSFIVKKNGTALDITEAGGTLSGTDVTAGTLNKTNGDYSVTLAGTVGTVADYTSTVDLASSPIDTTVLVKPLAFNLTVDGTLYENITTGTTDASFTNLDLVSIINTAVGSTVASDGGSGLVLIEGLIGDSAVGGITIEDPTDLTTYDSGVAELFDATFVEGASNSITEDTAATNPTGAVGAYNDVITFEWVYTQDDSATTAFSLFAASPYNDDVDPIAVNVVATTGSRFEVSLFKVDSIKGNSLLEKQEISLIEETDDSGKQLLLTEVFDETHPYLLGVINSNYTGTANPSVSSEVTLTGGDEGDTPTALAYATAWQNFRKINKYHAEIFMDIYGPYQDSVKDIVVNYQWWGFGITTVPRGNDRADAITYRQGLSNTTDKMALYWNWLQIKDTQFTNSKVWTSRIGHIGQNFTVNSRVYFSGGKHAGTTNPFGLGGQLSNGFTVIKSDYDVNETDKALLDAAQINPIIIDPDYGPMTYGDRTLIPTNTDTSFIGTRRTYDYLKLKIYKEVLRRQVFEDNNGFYRELATRDAYAVVNPMKGVTLNDVAIICNKSNNTQAVLDSRNFVIDVVVQATPNSQFVTLYLDRLGQTQEVSSFVSPV